MGDNKETEEVVVLEVSEVLEVPEVFEVSEALKELKLDSYVV